MEAATDDELRLARRLKLGVRLVVYPTLLVLIAVAWHARQARGAEHPGPPVHHWEGGNAQLSAHATADGLVLTHVDVSLRLPCRDGSTFTESFVARHILRQSGTAATAMFDDEGVAHDGGAVRDHVELTASVQPGAVALTVSAWVNWTRADTGHVVLCELDAAPRWLTPAP